jgi:hypothetical protein
MGSHLNSDNLQCFHTVRSVHCGLIYKQHQHQQIRNSMYVLHILLLICSYVFRHNRYPQGAHTAVVKDRAIQ